MDIQIGDIWQCPIDFVDAKRTYHRRGTTVELTRHFRLAHQETEYEVNRLGKFRPAAIIGLERESNRYLAVPLYGLRDGALVVQVLQAQLQQKIDGKRQTLTLVEISASDVVPVSGKANEPVLDQPSIARVDEVRALARDDFDERRGRLNEKVLLKLVASYLALGWEAGVPAAFQEASRSS